MLVHQQPSIPAAPAAAPRKRRRRAPATGATEDCFTCRATRTKCDRRRPYCGPCLNSGNACQGYRTQLTWGVGVASRGKLRGMTLPVSIESNISVAERDRRCAREGSVVEAAIQVKELSTAPPEMSTSLIGGVGIDITTNYDFVNMKHPFASSALNSVVATNDFGRLPKSPTSAASTFSPSPAVPSVISTSHPSTMQYPKQKQELSTFVSFHKPSYLHDSVNPHQLSGVISSLSDYERAYTSNNGTPYFLPPPADTTTYGGELTAASTFLFPTAVTVSSNMSSCAPSITSAGCKLQFADSHGILHQRSHYENDIGIGSLHQQHMSTAEAGAAGAVAGAGNFSDPFCVDEMLANPDSEISFTTPAPSQPRHYQSNYSTRIPKSTFVTHIPIQLLNPQLVQLSPELRFLIDYYDQTVCPSIVTFDGPSNPYRTHVLKLAFQNGALMEAIYALASSHLQQRRKIPQLEIRRASLPKFSSKSSSQSSRSSISPPPPSDPILFLNPLMPTSIPRQQTADTSSALAHKNASIKLLNNQLVDSSLAVSDAAMATLLILCLYHACETGVGKFRTHLAGVKQLMGMRCVGKETGVWTWMETVFTWFDNMSASINNRDAQLQGGYLDMIAENNDDWGLESLTGCSRSLFMRLAGLGRINMLSQQDPTNFYKPGLYRQNQIEDDDIEPPRNENDGRDDFWASWNAMKSDLIAWKPCAKYAPTPPRHRSPDPSYSSRGFEFTQDLHPVVHSNGLSSPITKTSKAYEAVEKNHWLHSTNVWRYAAILYLDRLAYPHLPSSHHVFQDTVRIVLDHLSCIPTTSGLSKSLMWPLFVTGTECVVTEHRMLIRDRCFDMQRDCGFFNKVSGLNVLENIWDHEADEDSALAYFVRGSETIGGRGLKWRRITQHEDGEYLMI